MSVPNPQEPHSRYEPLVSDFADDADMLELVELFILDLQARIISLREAFDSADFEQLSVIAHQLKGAGGGYGFPTISAGAEDLENILLAGEAEVSAVNEKTEALIQLCRCATT